MKSPLSVHLNFALAGPSHSEWLKGLYSNPDVMAKIQGGVTDASRVTETANK